MQSAHIPTVHIGMCIGADKMDGKTTDGLFDELSRVHDVISSQKKVCLSFGDVKFVSASGLTWFIAILCGLSKEEIDIEVSAPRDPEVCAWLEVMRFFEYCQKRNIMVSGYTPQGLVEADSEEVLLELTPITSTSDVSRVTAVVIERLKHILQSHLGYDERDIHNVSSAISEACDNICDHSQGEGIVAAQRHTSRAGVPFVAIGVADSGIGIRESLSCSYPEMATLSHEHAIQSALQKGISGKGNEDRGFGLPHIKQIVQNYSGRLQIRSGSARLSLVEEIETYSSAFFPGTQLCLSLSKRLPL